ncbi:MAG: DinB family protein [Dehalococcoidia bacterium]
MGREAIELLAYLMDEAFDGNDEHSLLWNLRSVGEDGWLWLPPGGGRSVYDIVRHVGECTYVYESHAFGDGAMRWDRPGTIPPTPPAQDPAGIIGWLRDGHRRVRESLLALHDDTELRGLRRANWGQECETRWLLNVLLQHDLYHSGEINHLRSLQQGTDRWAWQEG